MTWTPQAEQAELHCIGGFVISALYRMPRSTADIDFLAVAPADQTQRLVELGGQGSPLQRKHGVFVHNAAVANIPDNYETRLVEMFPGAYSKLRPLALDPYDLALTKLERNIDRDREDVKYLARQIPLSVDELERRYREELRPYLGNLERHDLTMKLWVEMIREEQTSRAEG